MLLELTLGEEVHEGGAAARDEVSRLAPAGVLRRGSPHLLQESRAATAVAASSVQAPGACLCRVAAAGSTCCGVRSRKAQTAMVPRLKHADLHVL